MPFMDGLQLCKIVKERMPWIEIVILSGHDEFEYAQKAIKLDVKDYLLKPITVQELHRVLDSLYQRFEEKRKEKDAYLQLQQQLQESYELRKEKFLQQLLIGALSVDEMIGQSKSFGLDIFGMAYLVIIVKIILADHAKTFNFEKYLSLQSKIQDFANSFKNLILVKINWEDYALILIGNNVEQAKQQHTIIVEKLKNELYSIVHQISSWYRRYKKSVI
jgi:two-component system response regulator YesN